jgi:hypothetical protein
MIENMELTGEKFFSFIDEKSDRLPLQLLYRSSLRADGTVGFMIEAPEISR